jgi:hypothetical protein
MTLCVPLLPPEGSDSPSQLASEAVALLLEAHATGFFGNRTQRERLQTDGRLAPLHETEGFRKLLADLGKD